MLLPRAVVPNPIPPTAPNDPPVPDQPFPGEAPAAPEMPFLPNEPTAPNAHAFLRSGWDHRYFVR